MPVIRPWIDNQPLAARGREVHPVTRPWDGRAIGRIELATERDLDRAIAGAKNAFGVMRDLPTHLRRAILLHTAELLRQGIDSLVIQCAVGQSQHASADLHHDRVGGFDDFLSQGIGHEMRAGFTGVGWCKRRGYRLPENQTT